MSHDAVKWIAVHFCEVCGAHVHEEAEHDMVYEAYGRTKKHIRTLSYFTEAIALERCDECGMLVCESCLDNRWCCDRRCEIELEGRPISWQMALFETTLEEPPMAY